MAKDPDYSVEIMAKALYFLGREKLIQDAHYKQFDAFITQVNNLFKAPLDTTLPEAMDIVPTSSVHDSELTEKYIPMLQEKIFDTTSMLIPGSDKYRHHYSANIQATAAATGAKMAKLMKVGATGYTTL